METIILKFEHKTHIIIMVNSMCSTLYASPEACGEKSLDGKATLVFGRREQHRQPQETCVQM